LHLLTAGTDRGQPALRTAVAATTLAVFVLVMVRINRDVSNARDKRSAPLDPGGAPRQATRPIRSGAARPLPAGDARRSRPEPERVPAR
jgi:hypothetical protein